MYYRIGDLKPGVIIELEGRPHQVIWSQHSKLGRGAGIMRTKLKNLISQALVSRTFKGEEKIKPAYLEKTKAQFLYHDGANFYFMNSTNFEQFALPSNQLGKAKNYLIEGSEIVILSYLDQPINIELPVKMKLKVVHAEPGIKGDTKTSPTKSVTLETGQKLSVPLFIKEGDQIIVDTRTGEYVERV